MESYFNRHGYFKEIYVCSKFIGIIEDVQLDRETIGFFGIKNEVLLTNIVCTNKRVVKKGTAIQTMIYPSCGAKKV